MTALSKVASRFALDFDVRGRLAAIDRVDACAAECLAASASGDSEREARAAQEAWKTAMAIRRTCVAHDRRMEQTEGPGVANPASNNGTMEAFHAVSKAYLRAVKWPIGPAPEHEDLDAIESAFTP